MLHSGPCRSSHDLLGPWEEWPASTTNIALFTFFLSSTSRSKARTPSFVAPSNEPFSVVGLWIDFYFFVGGGDHRASGAALGQARSSSGASPATSIRQFNWSYKLRNMFKNTFQSGFLSILYSLGTKPLQIWDKEVVDGHIKRPQDEDIQSNVLEIIGTNVQSTYITCPADPSATLGIKLPFLAIIVKNLKKYFTFEIQVLDDKNVRRRFRASNFQSVTRVKPYICTMPLKLDDGWNNIQLNLADLTKRAYGTNYVETLRVQVHANCRLRRIYFSDRLYSEEELPPEFKLYLPIQKS
ncbi:unnamed protein product [Urochloa decumbens]